MKRETFKTIKEQLEPKYKVLTHSGTLNLICDKKDDTEKLLLKAKKLLSQETEEFPGFETFEIIEISNR